MNKLEKFIDWLLSQSFYYDKSLNAYYYEVDDLLAIFVRIDNNKVIIGYEDYNYNSKYVIWDFDIKYANTEYQSSKRIINSLKDILFIISSYENE